MGATTDERRAALAASIARFVEAVEEQPDRLFLQAVDGRTPRDIVAHLIGWNRNAIEVDAALRRGELHPSLGDPGPNFSKTNALSMARYDSRDKGQLLGQLRDSAADYDAMLRALPEVEWDDNHGVFAGRWAVTNGSLAGALVRDFDEHREEIEHWPVSAVS